MWVLCNVSHRPGKLSQPASLLTMSRTPALTHAQILIKATLKHYGLGGIVFFLFTGMDLYCCCSSFASGLTLDLEYNNLTPEQMTKVSGL